MLADIHSRKCSWFERIGSRISQKEPNIASAPIKKNQIQIDIDRKYDFLPITTYFCTQQYRFIVFDRV